MLDIEFTFFLPFVMSQTNKLKKSGEQIAFNWINGEELVTCTKSH